MIRSFIISISLIFAAETFAQTAWWEQQNPKPQSNSLYDVAMLDATTYVAVGDYGVVLKTTDDGQSWARQIIAQGSALKKLAFSGDRQHAITISYSGRIWYSSDQAQTWELSSYTDTTILNGICFRTELDAFGVGRFGRLIHTTDAGKTWSPLAMEIPDILLSVHFPDSLHGFIGASYGIFYTTTDGGKTWRRREFPYNNSLYAIHAANANEVVAAGEAAGIFLSNDGGETWKRQEIKWGLGFYDAVRLNSQKAFVCGERYSFYSTLNGGTSWDPVLGGVIIKPFNLYGLAFADQISGVCVGTDGVIFRTTNGGDSWYRIYFNVAEEEALRGIHCLDSTTVIAVGSTILRTSDRGNKWEQVPVSTYQNLRAVDFPTREIGYAVGDYGVVMKTTDEGLTWRRLQTPFPSSLTAVSFLNKDTGIAVASTDRGTIVQTWDGGISWKVGKAPFTMWLLGAKYLSPSTIIVGGFENSNAQGIERGVVLRSTDGGWRWDSTMLNVPIVQCMSFADSLHGYIAGAGISRTSDGGQTWIKSFSSLASVRGISAPDSLRATAVTSGGGSLHTTDGGIFWEGVPTGASVGLYAVHHPLAQSATAVGFHALILRMTTTDPPLAVKTYIASAATDLVVALYPNPARGRITVQTNSTYGEPLVLRLYSIDGTFLRELYAGSADDKQNSIECDLAGLRSGSYVLRASTGSRTEHHSIVILQ